MKDNLDKDIGLVARFFDRVEFFNTYAHLILPFRFPQQERARRDQILLRRQWSVNTKESQ